MDIAKAILDHVDADERQKALAQHAFEVAPHEHALAPMLAQINIPRDAKADLWNAKRQSMHDPKLTRLAQIAALPKNILEIAESHPNVTKLLMTEDKEKSLDLKSPHLRRPQKSQNRPKIQPRKRLPKRRPRKNQKLHKMQIHCPLVNPASPLFHLPVPWTQNVKDTMTTTWTNKVT